MHWNEVRLAEGLKAELQLILQQIPGRYHFALGIARSYTIPPTHDLHIVPLVCAI